MLQFPLKAFKQFLKVKEPAWPDDHSPPIDFQGICYYSDPKQKPKLNSMDEADPKLIEYFNRLEIPLNERNRLANVAVDAVFDSVSIFYHLP